MTPQTALHQLSKTADVSFITSRPQEAVPDDLGLQKGGLQADILHYLRQQ